MPTYEQEEDSLRLLLNQLTINPDTLEVERSDVREELEQIYGDAENYDKNPEMHASLKDLEPHIRVLEQSRADFSHFTEPFRGLAREIGLAASHEGSVEYLEDSEIDEA